MPKYKIVYIKEINVDRDDAVYLAKLLQPENTELFQIVEENEESFELEA